MCQSDDNHFLDPAKTIVKAIGPGKTREITGMSEVQVWRWRLPKDRGGTGGRVPEKHRMKILKYLREHHLLENEDGSPATYRIFDPVDDLLEDHCQQQA